MPELDAILGVKIPVLDDGFVRVVDYMGNDAAIVQAARVSYGGTGTKKRSDDAGYDPLPDAAPPSPRRSKCARSSCMYASPWTAGASGSATAPLASTSIRLVTPRQSTPCRKRPLTNGACSQKVTSKDRRGFWMLELVPSFQHTRESTRTRRGIYYQKRLNAGIAREQARKDLPLSTYTEAYLEDRPA